MSTLLHVILDRAPALTTLAPECKGCPGTLCKGCHGTEHALGCPSSAARQKFRAEFRTRHLPPFVILIPQCPALLILNFTEQEPHASATPSRCGSTISPVCRFRSTQKKLRRRLPWMDKKLLF